MLGLGYLGSSSSSSASSNLSPLAPPFTVDRSNHNKPVVNSNSVSHMNDPSYGVSFTSTWPSYSHSSTAATPRTTTLASSDSGYMIPEAVNLPSAGNWNPNGKHGLEQITPGRSHWSSAAVVYPSPQRVTDYNLSFSEAKPFYPPYASSVNNDDVPLVAFSEASYDLLSASGAAHADDINNKSDYTRSLSGLEYRHQQESVWSGLPEGKQVKKMETDDSFFSEEANLAVYNNYFNQGAAYNGSEMSRKSKDDPSLFYYADIIRRANNYNNTGGPSSANGNGASATATAANNYSRRRRVVDDPNEFRAFPMFSESHPLIPNSPVEPREQHLWNSQNSYINNPPHDEKRSYHMFDCSDDHHISITKSSSTLVIKPPAVSTTTFSAQHTKSLEIGSLSALNINDHEQPPLKEKEQPGGGSFLPPNQLSFQIGIPDASSTKEGMSANGGHQLNFEFKARPPAFQVAEMSIPNVKTSTENIVKTCFEQFDHHNPAEDSPCWKGAPTSQFLLPFEAESTQPPMKKLQTGNGVDLQTDYSCFTSSSDVDEDAGVVSSCSKAGINGGVCSVHEPNKEHGGWSTSDDAIPPKPNSPTPEMDFVMPPEDAAAAADLAKAIKNVNSSGLVKSLYKLSDMLLLHCSNDESGGALKEHDVEALDHVIRNLGVCMSRSRQVQVTTTSAQKSHVTQNSSNIIIMSQEVVNEASASASGGVVLHGDDETGCYQKPRMSDDEEEGFGKNVEKLLEHASLRVEAKDDNVNMVQAIKKVLDENLECKVELPSETLLYKNLWLEAEAELCSFSFRARFQRLKKTHAHYSIHAAAAAAASSGAAINQISSCSDPKIPPSFKHPIPAGAGVDADEADVMARFSILKRREVSNPVNVQDVSGIKDCGKGSQVPEATVIIGKDIDPWVMDRLNILKRRGELNASDVEEKQVNPPMGGPHFQDEAEEEEEEEAAGSGGGSDWEHILKDEFSWRLS